MLALEQYGAGPWATLQLADMGAEVIKIEDPESHGDVGRYIPPFRSEETSLFFETFNRNKKSIGLDMKTQSGRHVFERLVEKSHIVFSNLRGDLVGKLGLTYEDLASTSKAIVCCSLSGFGLTGPRASQGAYDYMVQGLAGWMSLTGEPDGPPTKTGLSLVDLSAGHVATIAMLAALSQARETGVGGDCDISLFETALAQLIYLGTWSATESYVPTRWSNSAHPSIVPFQNFRTADGWIVVACPKEKFWIRLCQATGLDHLVSDLRYMDFDRRLANRSALIEELSDTFAKRTCSEWIELLVEAGVPCSPVNDVSGALSDPQAIAREVVVDVDHPTLGVIKQVASPLRFSQSSVTYLRAPFLGEHTEQILSDLAGLGPVEIETLAATKTITLGRGPG